MGMMFPCERGPHVLPAGVQARRRRIIDGDEAGRSTQPTEIPVLHSCCWEIGILEVLGIPRALIPGEHEEQLVFPIEQFRDHHRPVHLEAVVMQPGAGLGPGQVVLDPGVCSPFVVGDTVEKHPVIGIRSGLRNDRNHAAAGVPVRGVIHACQDLNLLYGLQRRNIDDLLAGAIVRQAVHQHLGVPRPAVRALAGTVDLRIGVADAASNIEGVPLGE